MTGIEFFHSIGIQKPLWCVRGDIFFTPADHIAFAVNFPALNGSWGNNEGFAAQVIRFGWEDLASIKFERGVPISKKIRGKTFHALPIHSNEPGGWNEAPELICHCFNILPVDSIEVITTILMGGGKSGKKYKANVNNIAGMSKSHKTIVLYIKDTTIYDMCISLGVVAASMPISNLPKTYKFREIKMIENGYCAAIA